MGQKPFHWFRLSRASRDKQKQSQLQTEPQPHLFSQSRPSGPRSPKSHHRYRNHRPKSPSPPISPNHLTEENYFQTLPQPFDPTLRESDTSGHSSNNSSSIPFHSSSPRISRQTSPDTVPAHPPVPRSRSSRRARPDASSPNNYDHNHHQQHHQQHPQHHYPHYEQHHRHPQHLQHHHNHREQAAREQPRDWRQHLHARIAFGRAPDPSPTTRSGATPPRYIHTDANNPASPVHTFPDGPRSIDDAQLSFELNQLHSASFASETAVPSVQSSVANSAADAVTGHLDNFVPHRPADRYVNPNIPGAVPIPDPRFSATSPDVISTDSASPERGRATEGRHRYLKKLGDAQSKFIFRRKRTANSISSDGPKEPIQPQDDYFGATQHDDRGRSGEIRAGEEVLIRFLRNTLGPKAQNLAVRLMNKTPITSSTGFTYVIHQGTEESDIDIIRRDLTSGRLYSSGVRLLGGAWCNLLLGDRFAPGSAPRQRHELTYRRSSCSCIICSVRALELTRAAESDARSQSDYGSEVDSNGISADVLSTMSTTSRTPIHSAMANFVVRYRLPEKHLLMGIGASSSSRELEIGSVVRLNYRASAKLKFTEDVRELFGHYAYTGPISHEEVYRQVTTIGVHYYLYNKGKKERKVYIQGELIRLPINVGVIKLGTQPMYMPELGATFCLHRKQIMSIYVGEIVLEGNSIGSFINTGIQYYIGFGEERGVCPVYPNKTLGKARKLGINELLLHHHMVDDLEVKCL